LAVVTALLAIIPVATVPVSPVVTTLPATSGNAIVLLVFVFGAVIVTVPEPLAFGDSAILLICYYPG
jgi:hypothetical protein